MDGQRTQLAAEVVDRTPRIPGERAADPVPAPSTPRPARRPRASLDQPLSTTWSVVLGVGWPLVVMAALALEPAPTDPDAPVSLVIELAGLAALFSLLATSVAAGIRHRGAAVAGVVSGLLLATFVVACPVSGHHAIGLWWYAELALVLGMLGVSLAALGDRARGVNPGKAI